MHAAWRVAGTPRWQVAGALLLGINVSWGTGCRGLGVNRTLGELTCTFSIVVKSTQHDIYRPTHS